MESLDDAYRFKSDLFEIEPGEDEEVNPHMYGRQLTLWLKDKLQERGRVIEDVFTEDWGRCIMCSSDEFPLWVGVGSQTDYKLVPVGHSIPPKESVTWHCFAVVEVPFWKRLFGKPDTSVLLAELNKDLLGILESEPRIVIERGSDAV